MAKQLTEQELRRQAVQALSDSLGPVDALRFLALVSRESSIIKNGVGSIFRGTTTWMNYCRKFASITALKILSPFRPK